MDDPGSESSRDVARSLRSIAEDLEVIACDLYDSNQYGRSQEVNRLSSRLRRTSETLLREMRSDLAAN